MVFISIILPGQQDRDQKSLRALGEVEIGIDSLERRFIRPHFRFEFDFLPFILFTDMSYYQVMNGRLQGDIDYWVMVGLQQKLNANHGLELRLNHMCRHVSSRWNPRIFDVNEVVGRWFFSNQGLQLALGGGGFTGGSTDYRWLVVLDLAINKIWGTEISFGSQVKFVDFNSLYYETELQFALAASADLFVRHTRYYGKDNTTYIGMRIKSAGPIEKFFKSYFLDFGISPFHEMHKILTDGFFRLAFFENSSRKVILTMGFSAPILRGDEFFETFYPEKMIYPVRLEYERAIGSSIYLSWYGRYELIQPLDQDQEFRAELATGLLIKNQSDFNRIEKPMRFSALAGYNFKQGVEVDLHAGATLFRMSGFVLATELGLFNHQSRFRCNIKLLSELGRSVTFRPFVEFQISRNRDIQDLPDTKLVLGVGLYRWF